MLPLLHVALSLWERVTVTASAAALLLAPSSIPAAAQDAHRTTVTVSDHLSQGQDEETIAVYFAGVLTGTLHVTGNKPDDSFTAALPDRDHLAFTLCGKLVTRDPDGAPVPHPIDNGGVLRGYASQILMATTLGDVLFSLQSEDPAVVTTVQPGPACSAAVS